MNTEEKVQLFYESICCCYPMYRWEYDQDFVSVYSHGPKEMEGFDLLQFLGIHEVLKQEVQNKTTYPVILETNLGLEWLIAFDYQAKALHRIHILGPVFAGNLSKTILIHRLNRFHFSPEATKIALHLLDQVSIIPPMILNQYAIMLHYQITTQALGRDEVLYRTIAKDQAAEGEASKPESTIDRRAGVYQREKEFLALVREGNPGYRQLMNRMANISPGVRSDIKDPLRQAKNNTLVLLTLVSRTAMEGGLPASISYSLMDFYSERIEEAPTFAAVVRLNQDLIDDYVIRIQEVMSQKGVSAEILECQQYIQMNIEKPFSVAQLAGRAGYSPYYFSLKFKKETHQGVSDYIMQKKMEKAALYLRDTSMSIEQIQETLSLVSRSHFYETFKKWNGMSPIEYRKSLKNN